MDGSSVFLNSKEQVDGINLVPKKQSKQILNQIDAYKLINTAKIRKYLEDLRYGVVTTATPRITA